MSLKEQALKAIRAEMPPSAEIDEIPDKGRFTVDVSWKLNDDPERPNKMSKTISICVSNEAAKDFDTASAADQEAAYRRISTFLSKKLAVFNPQHELPKSTEPPVDLWVITSAVVLGNK
jgi:hypothetical protein